MTIQTTTTLPAVRKRSMLVRLSIDATTSISVGPNSTMASSPCLNPSWNVTDTPTTMKNQARMDRCCLVAAIFRSADAETTETTSSSNDNTSIGR
ncbi:hypothetical protein GALL_551100 [mine drainage metagenome]|uniref:Uncharacterized protein n=1 Tax=mine drainage metagenome TaxID=410659 RepID=A0A1J5PIF9_9ZZZZ